MRIERISDGYRVDGEIGRFQFDTYSAISDENDRIFNTATDFFPRLKPKERYLTSGFKEIGMILGDTRQSYRKTTELINRTRYQQVGGTPHRTLNANTKKEGSELIDYFEKKSKYVLKKHRFSEDGSYKGDPDNFNSVKSVLLPEQTVKQAASRLDCEYPATEILDNPVCMEDPSESTNISIDDVCTKKQREKRRKEIPDSSEEKPKRKYVHDTVVRIEKDNKRYSLVGDGIKTTILYLIAFLLSNKLQGGRFQFFTDGHTVLNDTICACFKWYPNFGIILDWFHLVKKCKEMLSMAMKGRFVRKEILQEIMPLLWLGLTDRAIAILKGVDPNKVKNHEKLSKLIKYLERNKSMIPCYALRKKLGLRNSSAIGEKMNDLLVSSRQKHNSMSWSKNGSLALAALTATKYNGESQIWLEDRKLNFRLAA